MRFDIVTIFTEFFSGPLDYGIVRRAREAGLIEVVVHDLRRYTHDRHRTVDDRPFGGGEGMVMKPEPFSKRWRIFSASRQRMRGEQRERRLCCFRRPETVSAGDGAAMGGAGAAGAAVRKI